MKKIITKSVIFYTLILGLLSFVNRVALAAVECTINGRQVDCAEMGSQIKGFLGWGIGILILLVIFGIGMIVFWIMMIFHAAKYNVENKAIWIILMVFTGLIGALVYYFVVKKNFNNQPPAPTPAPINITQ